MTIADLFRKGNRRRQAEGLYAALVARARAPVFFVSLGVSDTPDGRFDVLALHAFLALEGLRGRGDLAEALVAALFRGFEDALRDQGAGDIGMVKSLKKIADAFYGRLKAYGEAADEAAFAAALTRNLYRGEAGHEGQARALARYAACARARIAAREPGSPLDFGPKPE
jgi:cytochrome b pre-mRNA-processing protein 3